MLTASILLLTPMTQVFAQNPQCESLIPHNILQPGDFGEALLGAQPFGLGLLPPWQSSHGSPNVDDGRNCDNENCCDPVYALMYAEDKFASTIKFGEGIFMDVSICTMQEYRLSFYYAIGANPPGVVPEAPCGTAVFHVKAVQGALVNKGSYPEPNVPTGPYEHAHKFKTGCWPFRKDRRTIMYSVVDERQTIQHYSNPAVKFKDVNTGIADERDNARMLKNTACTVAGFRESGSTTLELLAHISGDYFACPCKGVGLTSQNIGCDQGPFEYEWRTSLDGFNWSSIQSTQSSYYVGLSCEVGEGVFVSLRMSKLGGASNETFAFIEVAEQWPGQ